MKKFREIVREASQAVYGNKQQGGNSLYRFITETLTSYITKRRMSNAQVSDR